LIIPILRGNNRRRGCDLISNGKEFDNRFLAGQQAVDRGNWRLAYDCFMDCLEYLRYYEAWREAEIKYLEKLIKNCVAMIW
jgi:hypothetical protein